MALIFNGLTLALRDRPVLQAVNGLLQEGQITVVLGANGAGKSTLLSVLAALRSPDEGTVEVDGANVFGMTATERGKLIGLLPQQAEIHWNVNVRSLVALGRMPHQGRWGASAEDNAAVERAMIATDCTHLADRKAQRLSGGEQARVLLARVLAGEPRWILADEPFASLDPAHQMHAAASLRKAADAGAGVVIVLHDLTQAARIADHVLLLKEGRLLAAGAVEQVMTSELLEQAYGIRVHHARDDEGGLLVVPVARVS